MAVSVYRLLAARLRKPAGSSFRSLNVERLRSICTVMGLFEAGHCETVEVEPAPGDTLLLYTDGITKAANADGQEFGESRLLDTLASHSHLRAGSVLQAAAGRSSNSAAVANNRMTSHS
jgi:serine phosphatase RsbU (regulator of sigma subunit)